MAWSITYHSWLTFILLLWSCVLWMVPRSVSRLACLRSSPALVAYAELLLLLQYLYSLALTDEELPQNLSTVNLAQVGLIKYHENSYQPLAVKILFTVMFWITLRQYIEHKTAPPEAGIELRRQMSTATSSLGMGTQLRVRHLGRLISEWLTHYWIWVVAIMLMVISLGGTDVVLYRIAYMLLFLFFILISYQLWIKVMYGFWLTVIIYSMLVLILIYTYQFEKFPEYWSTYLHIPQDIQKDIGLEVYQSDPGTLFLKLLTPTFFLIITIIQLHYFHKERAVLSDLELSEQWAFPSSPAPSREEESSESRSRVSPLPGDHDVSIPVEDGPHPQDDSEDAATPATMVPSGCGPGTTMADVLRSPKAGSPHISLERIGRFLSQAAEVGWRLLEIHTMKGVLLAVCAVHVVFVLLAVVALPFRWLQLFLVHCCSVWASVLLLSKMIYQLNFVDKYGWSTNCTVSLFQDVIGIPSNMTGFPAPFNTTIDNRIWIGFEKTSNLTSYCKGYIMLIVVFSAHAMVRYRQSFSRARHQLPEPRPGVVFASVNRFNADDGIRQCLMYLLNFFFYKFGVEVCFVTMVSCIGVRLDVFALLTSLWLCAMFLLRRHSLAKVWPFYVAYLCLVLPLQYLVVVGLPPGLCIEYPWWDPSNKTLRETALWLYLPDFQEPPLARKILVDFVQLLFACCQLYVFFLEGSQNSDFYEGGSNKEIYDKDGLFIGQTPNPIADFVTYTKSYLSMVKVFLFFSFYWITLAVMFLAGTNRVSLFAMGYVLDFSEETCVKDSENSPRITHGILFCRWNTLLAYNVTVIFIKCILQASTPVVGCVFLDELAKKSCWVVQLLGIACLKKLQPDGTAGGDGDNMCRVPVDEAGLLWDGICLAFLLVQKRLFTSYYFHHLIIEILAQQQLASRGAEMIHEIQMKDVQEQRAAEKDIMEKIKRKMDKIRANQQKVRGGEYVEPETHFQGEPDWAPHRFHFSTLGAGHRGRKGHAQLQGLHQVLRQGGEYSTPYSTPAGGQSLLEEEPPPGGVESPSVGQLTVSPVSAGYTAYLDSYMEPRLSTAGQQQHVRLSSVPRPTAAHAPARNAGGQRSSHYSALQRLAALRQAGSPPCLVVFPQPSKSSSKQPATSSDLPSMSAEEDKTGVPEELHTEHIDPPTEQPAEELQQQLEEQPPAEDTLLEKVVNLLAFSWALLDSMLISATAKLNSVSRDYRYVARKLADEKRIVKAQFVTGLATTLNEPALRNRKFHFHKHSEEVAPSHPSLVRFLIACYYAIVSRSEVVCYLVIVLNQMKSASLLSLPLPLMAFLWGSLSVPRPTKAFWITIITYTEAIVVIKYLFQFDFFDWNESGPVNRPFDPPRILGIEKRKEDSDYALYDLLLLLLVFFHRFMLKSLGLWKDTDRGASVSVVQSPPEPALCGEVRADRQSSDHASPDPATSGFQDEASEVSTELLQYGDQLVAFRFGVLTWLGGDCLDERFFKAVCESEFWLHSLRRKVFLEVSVSSIKIPSIARFLQGCSFCSVSRYVEPFHNFFENLLHPVYRVTTDVYAYMFFCDFINFFIMVFGYWAFGVVWKLGGYAALVSPSQVPVPFLIMLLAQFALIVIDRALYLRKYILGKLIFQVFIVFVIHIWMFFVLPGISQRSFVEEKNLPPKLWYFIKCIYLILSAYQIRSGYPTRILGNFFCKKYNYINYFLFKGYMLIPFLYELRSLMDWIWTDTSMNLSNWLKMEDIFANVFLLKCQRRAEEEYPTPRGSRRSSLTKYGLGGILLFAIILVIWFPLLLFSLGNTVGQSLLPMDCTFELSLGGYEPIFKISAQQGSLQPLPYDSWVRLQVRSLTPLPLLPAFLATYDASDVAVVRLNGNSTAIWTVSPPSQEALIKELGGAMVPLRLRWTFARSVDNTNADKVVGNEHTVQLVPNTTSSLAEMLNGTSKNVSVPSILPRFLLVPRKGKVEVVRALDLPDREPYRNLTLRLRTGAFKNLSARSEWWEVQESCTDAYPYPFLRDDQGSCSNLSMVVFNEKVFPQALSQLTGYGIVGLYTTFVLVVSRLIRGFMAGSSFIIMFDDIPNVDR
ncbi:conserved hypothetical protein, partial [Ixodes scapularis]